VGYEIPVDEVRGSATESGSAALRFGVSLTLRGEPDSAAPASTPCSPVDGARAADDADPTTGADSAGTDKAAGKGKAADKGKAAGKDKTAGRDKSKDTGRSGIAGAAGNRPPWGSMPHTGATSIAPLGALLGMIGGLILVWRRRTAESESESEPKPELAPTAVPQSSDHWYRPGRNKPPYPGVDTTRRATSLEPPDMWSTVLRLAPDPRPNGPGHDPRKEAPRGV
jgi:hypothetical protein